MGSTESRSAADIFGISNAIGTIKVFDDDARRGRLGLALAGAGSRGPGRSAVGTAGRRTGGPLEVVSASNTKGTGDRRACAFGGPGRGRWTPPGSRSPRPGR